MSRPAAPEPLYLAGPDGPLFCLWYGRAAEGRRPNPTIVYLPPFAEEMNRARRTIARLGQALAARDIGLFVPDLFGTGDSAGDFAAARWAGWLADGLAAIRFLRDADVPVPGTLGLRTGALLALAIAQASNLPRAMLWQPVDQGSTFLTQLLRTGAASAMGEAAKVTPAALRAELDRGDIVEIAGYPITSGLATDLEAASLAATGAGYSGTIDWCHLGAEPEAELPPGIRNAIARLAAGSAGPVRPTCHSAAAFWLLEEAPIPDGLITATVDSWIDAALKEGVA